MGKHHEHPKETIDIECLARRVQRGEVAAWVAADMLEEKMVYLPELRPESTAAVEKFGFMDGDYRPPAADLIDHPVYQAWAGRYTGKKRG